MVPLRTLPVDVTGEPIKESDFRKVFKLDRMEAEIDNQDIDKAWGQIREDTSSAFELCFGSMLLTLPGEYMRENFHYEESPYLGEGKALDIGGDGRAVIDHAQPIQQYEFDGFSIDVFGVGAGPLLEEYLAEKGLVIPEGGGLERYADQYIAVIESESKPPIDEEDFEELRTVSPNYTEELEWELRSDPDRTPRQLYNLKRRFHDVIEADMGDEIEDYEQHYLMQMASDDLIDALFGRTDFEGEVIQVELPLDDGKIFFPLGTSSGWPNPVGDIDVLFRVPGDKDLELDSADDAYFFGSHWYLFQMENANPGFDLDSDISEGSEQRRAEAERAAWLNENSVGLGFLMAFGVLVVLWLVGSLIVVRRMDLEGGVLRNRYLWLLLGLSFLVSIPGALLLYLVWKPLSAKEFMKRAVPLAPVAMYPVTLVVFIVGGII
jgi:hypothetical protein